jgi:hypothetical protein
MAKRTQKQPRGAQKRRTTNSFRKEIVDLHREIFRRNKKRINDSVYGYTALFKQYEDEHAKATLDYQKRASFEELDRQLHKSNICYFGDYHTLPQAQRSFLRILRRLPPEREVIIALEFFQGRHQKHVDAFMAGKLGAEEFLKITDHESGWGFGDFPSFEPILELAKERNYKVLAIDTRSYGLAGSSLAARDKYAARKITKALKKQPNALVMTLIGELHIAPAHLPHDVHELLKNHDIEGRTLIIYQNCERIFWKLEEKGLEHSVAVVKVRPGEYCMNNTPPIVCQQSFLNWLDVEDAPELEAPEHNFRQYANLIAEFFDLPLGNALDELEITSVIDLSFLQRLARRGDFSDADMVRIREQILDSESYYIPQAKMAYLGNLSANHTSEEATHFLRHVCAKSFEEPQLLLDAFYSRSLEEAIGFMGSKIINHKRKAPPLPYFERLSKSRKISADEKKFARLVLKHVHLEKGVRVRNMDAVYDCGPELFNQVTHVLGYRLGERLYYALVEGILNKSQMRELFFYDFSEEGLALQTYFELMTITRNVIVPTRL